jgi:ribose 5-phosphate isomerase B
MKKGKIILATDHAGFALKEEVKKYLLQKGYSIEDVGAHTFVDGDDYPEYMIKVGMMMAQDIDSKNLAIIFGGSGQGEAMVVNRFPGVRAVVWYGGSVDVLKLSRQHNNANVLSIGARFVDTDTAIKAIEIWLNTPFSGEERHIRRLSQIDNIQ